MPPPRGHAQVFVVGAVGADEPVVAAGVLVERARHVGRPDPAGLRRGGTHEGHLRALPRHAPVGSAPW